MINLFAPMNNYGVGTHAFNMAMALDKRGHNICLIPPFGGVNKNHFKIGSWLANRADFNVDNPSLMIFDTGFLTQFSGTPRIGFAVFETNGFRPDQLAAIRSCNIVLTPSKWGQAILQRHNIQSHVINEGVDVQFFGDPIECTGPVRFLHVGKFEERKGTLQMIRCFFNALEREDAELVIHSNNQFVEGGGYLEIVNLLSEIGFRGIIAGRSGEMQNTFKYAGLMVKISHPRMEIVSLYKTADCGIFLSKGEGWGLPIIECLASGTPVIAGIWSAPSEYLNENCGYIIDDAKLENANDGIWFNGNQGEWYVPNDESVIKSIRQAFESARAFKQSPVFKAEVERIRKDFTWENSAIQLEKLFDNLNLSF